MAKDDFKEICIDKIDTIIDAYDSNYDIKWELINMHLDKILDIIDEDEEEEDSIKEEEDEIPCKKGTTFLNILTRQKKKNENKEK